MTRLVEIFRQGTHIDSAGVSREFTDEALQQIQSSYNPEKHSAPFLVNHDESKPNRGLVDRLVKIGQSLYAAAKNVDTEFQAQINDRRLPALSAALYAPNDPRNPNPGKWGLRHVAAVQIPAVKGMAPPQFADGGELLAIEFAELTVRDEEAPTIEVEAEAIDEPLEQKEPPMTEEELKALRKMLDERSAELDKKSAVLDAADFNNFAEGLLKEGRVFDAKLAAAIAVTLPSEADSTIAFGEKGDPLQSRSAFKKFLEALPKTVEFGELTAGAAPAKYDANAIATAARDYKSEQESKGNSISFSEAVAHVEKGVK
jgi:hypothetical protein